MDMQRLRHVMESKPDKNTPDKKDNLAFMVKCQGCESECEVEVAIVDGKAACLGGNNCPTGESFALSQCKANK